jgi:hypothetical protein
MNARFSSPSDIAIDGKGKLFVAPGLWRALLAIAVTVR